MKKVISIMLISLTMISLFNLSVFALDNSWQNAYYNKLIEIRERPGLLKILLSDKDINGYSTDFICYALQDYNQDGIPELIVYGTNVSAEAGDNYRVFTCKNGNIKEFEIISHKGPFGEGVSSASQPYWPYYTDFFCLPDGYINSETNELVWILKNEVGKEEYWAVAGSPYEYETIIETQFNFDKMTIDVVPVVYAEGNDMSDYNSNLKSWTDSHQLTINHDEYGCRIENNETLWSQLSQDKTEMPELTLINQIIIFINHILNRSFS